MKVATLHNNPTKIRLIIISNFKFQISNVNKNPTFFRPIFAINN